MAEKTIALLMGLSAGEKKMIWNRDDRRCAYCGMDGIDDRNWWLLEVDHVIPTSRGGSDDPSNLITACTICHRVKSAIEKSGESWPQFDGQALIDYIKRQINKRMGIEKSAIDYFGNLRRNNPLDKN